MPGVRPPGTTAPGGRTATPDQVPAGSTLPTAPLTTTPGGTQGARQPFSLATPPSSNQPEFSSLFGGPSQGGTDLAGLGQSGIPQMIGDLGPGLRIANAAATTIPQPFPPPGVPRPPGPRKAPSLVPSVRGQKIADNQSPRPQDRVFFTFDYFSNLNGPLNQRLGAPVRDVNLYRNIFGFEKTFFDGNASFGMRLPLDQLTSNSIIPARFTQVGGTTTGLDNLNLFAKVILWQDTTTGNLVSGGLAISPTTAGGRFAGAPYLQYVNTTDFQPFVGYIWNRGNFYLHGFSAFDFPVNNTQASEMYNDVGIGYFLFRSDDPNRFLTAVAPTFEVHVNTPLNHHGFDNPHDLGGTPTVVDFTYGVSFEFAKNALLTAAYVNPVTGPRPFDGELMVLFNYRFGRSARRAIPPLAGG